MKTIFLSVWVFLACFALAQSSLHPILVSHDEESGPMGGEFHVEDLTVFSDGKVTLRERETHSLDQQADSSTYETTLSTAEYQNLSILLDRSDVRALPKKIVPKTRPIDFFWQKSLEITRPNGKQKVQIENFYPFLNLHGAAYSKGLIELECSIQEIQTKAAKRPPPKDEDNWCHEIVKQRGR